MAKERSAFVLPKNQKEIIDQLTDEEAGKIFKAIYEYECNKNIIKFNKYLQIIFTQFKIELDKNAKLYDERCQKNRENVQKRWENTNVYDRIRKIPTYTNDTNKRKENKIKENINNREREYKERENSNVAIATTPSLSSIISYGASLNVDEDYCENFFNYYEGIGWVNGTGLPIKNWKMIFKNWLRKDKQKENDKKNKRYF